MSQNPTFASQFGPKTPYVGKHNSEGGPLLVRVTHVVTGEFLQGTSIKDPDYNDVSDLGVIRFQVMNSNQSRSTQGAGNNKARPINSAVKQYPVEGEFVHVFVGPSIDQNTDIDSRSYYYSLPINLWNNSHHNALPNMGDYSAYINKHNQNRNQNLTQRSAAANIQTTASVSYPLNNAFPEQPDVRPLLHFIGDVTVEGRWGNSIRFGSTTVDGKNLNNWSKGGNIGAPILIIRNGQASQQNLPPWIPVVEDINRDPSSIYLTDGQEIVIDDINNNFSLTSLNVSLTSSYTAVVQVQQQVTNVSYISAADQDKLQAI